MALPILEAAICFLRREGKTLFIDYRDYDHPLHKGKYSAPGGKVEEEEPIEEGIVREVSEETGIKLNSVVYRGQVFFNNERRYFGGKPAKWSFRVHYFDCFDFDDSDAKASEGNLAWIADSDVLDLPMHDGDRNILEWLKDYREINAEIIHVGDNLTEAKLLDFKS